MLIQRQDWECGTVILIADEMLHGSVHVGIPASIRFRENPNDVVATIHSLWVDRGHRRYGTGKHLLETAEKEARQEGATLVKIEWNSFQEPKWMLQWYQRLGYEKEEEILEGRITLKKRLV